MRNKRIAAGIFAAISLILLTLLAVWLQQAVRPSAGAPVLRAVLSIPEMIPYRLHIYNGKLYVLPFKGQEIHVIDYSGATDRVIPLDAGIPRQFTDLAVDSDGIYLTTHLGELFVFTPQGKLADTFGYFPADILGGEEQEEEVPMNAAAVDICPQNLYLADSGSGRVLVLSLREVPGIVERFEVFMTVPEPLAYEADRIPAEDQLQRPVAAQPTPDGRLLVSDTDRVRVYSMRGWYAADFPAGEALERPGSIALDGVEAVRNNEVQPGGGRVHVLDKKNNEIVVYASEGHYLFSYGGGQMKTPGDLVIDKEQRVIFVADLGQGILKFAY